MLRIFKGDDTDFADANRLRITIGTAVVLAGCRAEFSFLGVTRQIPDASTGTFEVAFTAAETAVMPLGVHCATIRVFDAQGRQRTTTNTLRIEVTDNVDMAYSGENAADVDGHLVVKGVVDDGYGVPADLPEDYTPDEMRAFLNRLAALVRNSMPVAATLLMLAFAPAMGAEVEYARFGSMKATSNMVTSVDLSAKADVTNVYTKTETDARIVELAPMPDVSGKQDVLPYGTNAIPVDAVKWHSVYGDESMRHGWSITPDGTDPLYPGFTLYRGTGNAWPMPVLNVSTGGTVVLYRENGHVAFDALGIRPMFGGEIFWDDILTSSNVYKGTINYGMTDIFDLARVADTVRFVNDETGKKQDTLPYPTNEIPFSAIDGVPAETDPTIPAWAKAETPTNMVSAIVTNEVPILSDWVLSGDTAYFHHLNLRFTPASDAGGGSLATWYLYEGQYELSSVQDGEYATNLNFGAVGITATRTVLGNVNALGLARASDIPSTAEDVGAYSAASGNALAGTVSVWEAYWSGTNVVFEVTNYYGNTSGELPRLRVRELRDGTWHVVWDEVDKFRVCESNLLRAVSASNATMRTELAEDFAPKAWGTVTDKGTPNFVDNSVWMTSPETYFAGGTEYQRVAVGAGTICVLVDNGAAVHTAGAEGTFRFQDGGGTNYFGFAKSDSYTIGCRTDGITVEGSLVTLRYDVIMGGTDVPITYWTTNLSSGVWTQLNNADGTAAEGAPYTVTWYESGGSYYAAINCGMNPQGFFKAETSVAGDVVFETNMKARLGGGIECTNTQTGVMGVIRPSYNGSAVNWTWSAR